MVVEAEEGTWEVSFNWFARVYESDYFPDYGKTSQRGLPSVDSCLNESLG